MPTPTLIATPGATDANSYCTVAEANTYHDSHLRPADWTAADTSTKTIGLIMATRVMDAMFDWAGQVSTDTQALMWPRVGVLKRNLVQNVDHQIIPIELKNAVAEFARNLIATDRVADSDIETQGITSLTAGPISLSFSDDVKAKVVPDSVFHLLPSHWFTLKGRGARTARLART